MATIIETMPVEQIYQRLLKGLGHELVNDGNVDALIRRAEQDRHTLLSTELREWRAPCTANAKDGWR